MRVAVVGPQGPDLFADNVAVTLQDLGADVLQIGGQSTGEVKVGRRALYSRRLAGMTAVVADHYDRLALRSQRDWLAAVVGFRPDLLLTIDRRLHREVIAAAKQHGAKAALWFPDAVTNMGRHDMFLNGYDRVYLTNPVLVERLRDIYGLAVSYLPEACNPKWHRPVVPYGTEPVITIAGSIHPTRAALLDRLVGDGVPLRIFGPPIADWVGHPRLRARHEGEYVVGERKSEVFRSGRAVLNNLHPGEFAGMNCRLFEAAGCGALVITEQRTGLEDLFAIGSEVQVFGTYEELLGRIADCLDDPEVGRPIADAASRRAHAAHTYALRLSAILDDLCVS